MNKKWIALLTLISFLHFSMSCVIHRSQTVRQEELSPKEKANVLIMGVLTKSGEHTEFPENRPGRIEVGRVVGQGFSDKVIIEIDKDDIKKTSTDDRGNLKEITTKDGTIYSIEEWNFNKTKNIYYITAYKSISIPLSDVELLWIKKVDAGATFVATVGGIGATMLLLGLVIALTKESCPFIYAFDGEQFVFDAEPYGGAICQGLSRTEWSSLDYIEEVDGQYKILIKNEVAETQYTDEVKLIVVDHPEGYEMAPSLTGEMRTFKNAILPFSAQDKSGKDLMPYVFKNDWIFWQSSVAEMDPDRNGFERDELTFEFPKPHGAKTAKLLVNACTTLWGSQMIKQYLDLLGNTVDDWYAEIDAMGPAYENHMDLNRQAERYMLQIRVETAEGWETKGYIYGGGPFVSDDKAYEIDVSDVPGATLKLKLTPPPTFWMINNLAVDYSEDVPMRITELDAMNAVDWEGRDVSGSLAFEDNDYLVMPEIGQTAELAFLAPPQEPGFERSVFLKASGYYDIHLKKDKEPQIEILTEFMLDPESMNRYALKQYFKWQKDIVERLEIR